MPNSLRSYKLAPLRTAQPEPIQVDIANPPQTSQLRRWSHISASKNLFAQDVLTLTADSYRTRARRELLAKDRTAN